MYKLGLVGFGRMGQAFFKYHQLLKHKFPVSLVQICNKSNFDQLQNLKNQIPDLQITQNIEDIISNPELDAVIIATSTPTHLDCLKLVSKYNKTTLCEKPAGLNLQQLMEAQRAVEESGIKCMIGYNRRYDPTHQRIKKIVDNKELGKLLRISAHITEPKLTDFEYLQVSGGIFKDSVIHDFDMMNFYTGSRPVRLYAKGQVVFDERLKSIPDYDSVDIIIEYESGQLCYIYSQRQISIGGEQRYELVGSVNSVINSNQRSDEIIIRDENGEARSGYFNNQTEPFFISRFQESYLQELSAFYRIIMGKEERNVATIKDAVLAMKLAEAANKSALKGDFVEIDY